MNEFRYMYQQMAAADRAKKDLDEATVAARSVEMAEIQRLVAEALKDAFEGLQVVVPVVGAVVIAVVCKPPTKATNGLDVHLVGRSEYKFRSGDASADVVLIQYRVFPRNDKRDRPKFELYEAALKDVGTYSGFEITEIGQLMRHTVGCLTRGTWPTGNDFKGMSPGKDRYYVVTSCDGKLEAHAHPSFRDTIDDIELNLKLAEKDPSFSTFVLRVRDSRITFVHADRALDEVRSAIPPEVTFPGKLESW